MINGFIGTLTEARFGINRVKPAHQNPPPGALFEKKLRKRPPPPPRVFDVNASKKQRVVAV